MNNINEFCNIIRKRSHEHALAMSRIEDLPSMMISILRQEIDSLVRVIYLYSLHDTEEKNRLIHKH